MTEEQNPKFSAPVPDPTSLTTEALHREIRALRELIFERLDRNAQVADEKFDSVKTQLRLIERQRVEQKADTSAAVAAALSAAKEAVKEQTTASEARTDKSEASMIKSVEQLGEKFDTAFEGQRREVNDLKTRSDKGEGKTTGSEVTVGKIYAAIAAVGVVLGTLVLLANNVL